MLVTWLFAGIFYDDEFYEASFFTKYRPAFKIFFYSPTGQSDMVLDDLPSDKQKEEIAFEEFVIKQNVQGNPGLMQNVPYVLFQFTLTCLMFGIQMALMKVSYKFWRPLAHFLVNFIGTSVGMIMILWNAALWSQIAIGIAVVISNYFTAVVLARQKMTLN